MKKLVLISLWGFFFSPSLAWSHYGGIVKETASIDIIYPGAGIFDPEKHEMDVWEAKNGIEENWRNYQKLSPQEKRRLLKKRQEWDALPPKEKQNLRQQMDYWNRLSPKDRALFMKLFDQWQQLPAEERLRIRRSLEQWEDLSPTERESIRRKFLNR